MRRSCVGRRSSRRREEKASAKAAAAHAAAHLPPLARHCRAALSAHLRISAAHRRRSRRISEKASRPLCAALIEKSGIAQSGSEALCNERRKRRRKYHHQWFLKLPAPQWMRSLLRLPALWQHRRTRLPFAEGGSTEQAKDIRDAHLCNVFTLLRLSYQHRAQRALARKRKRILACRSSARTAAHRGEKKEGRAARGSNVISEKVRAGRKRHHAPQRWPASQPRKPEAGDNEEEIFKTCGWCRRVKRFRGGGKARRVKRAGAGA